MFSYIIFILLFHASERHFLTYLQYRISTKQCVWIYIYILIYPSLCLQKQQALMRYILPIPQFSTCTCTLYNVHISKSTVLRPFSLYLAVTSTTPKHTLNHSLCWKVLVRKTRSHNLGIKSRETIQLIIPLYPNIGRKYSIISQYYSRTFQLKRKLNFTIPLEVLYSTKLT